MAYLKKNKQLTLYQLFALFVMLNLALTFVNNRAILEISGKEGWISILLSLPLAYLAIVMQVALVHRYGTQGTLGLAKKILGKYLGTTLTLGILIFNLLLLSAALRIYLDVAYHEALKETPVGFLTGLYLLLALYGSTKSLVVIGRFSEIAFLMFLVIFMFIPIAVLQNYNLEYLKPIDVDILKIGTGVVPALNITVGYFVLSYLLPYVQRKEKIMLSLGAGLVFVALILMTFLMSLITVFGERRAQEFIFPQLKLLSVISTQIFERADVFLVISWSFIMMTYLIIFLKFATETLGHIFAENRVLKVMGALLYLGGAFIIVTRPQNHNDVYLAVIYLSWLGLGINFFVPLLLSTVAYFFIKGD